MTNRTEFAKVFTFMSDEIANERRETPGHNAIEFGLPGTKNLSASIKVYITGGENKMHSHPEEDHLFFVLSGRAMFHIEREDNTVELVQNNAVLLPRGTRYHFSNNGEDSLIMLRIGSGTARDLRELDGRVFKSNSDFWHHVEARVVS